MSSNGIVIHSNQISRAGLKQQVLKNGSSVLVRIIEDKGNGKFTGSVAGVRVNLTSSKSYSVGSSFVAKLNVVDGKIFVTLENPSIKENLPMELTVLQNNQLAALLKNLGLPVDSLSLNLFQQLKQMEMKFDGNLLKKLHSLALKFNGKEKAASEILMLLAEKNIMADSEEILNLLALLYTSDQEPDADDFRDKSLLNRINKTEGAWYLFPFEMLELDNSEIIGKGVIRTLVSKSGSLKQLNLDCNYDGKRYLFSMYMEMGKCKLLRFNISNFKLENIEQKVLDLNKRLLLINEKIKVEWAEEQELEGTACELENIYSFEGAV